MRLVFDWVREDRPGPAWQHLFRATWPAYRRWYLLEGESVRPALSTCRARLAQAMPELLPIWERLVELTGGDALAARMLSLCDPPPFLAGCSQAACGGERPLLVRNYDFDPEKTEALFLLSRWNGVPVLASSDGLWGALDGINGHGLAVALAFAGQRLVGKGFGITLILRYLLETCRDVGEAVAVLRRVPSHMAYNVSLVDASGRRCVAELSPGRVPRVRERDVTTNHQRLGRWPEYERRSGTEERRRALERHLAAGPGDEESLTQLFLEPPLFQTDYRQGFGTLYTVAYRPVERTARFLWRGAELVQSLDAFEEARLEVPLPG